MRQNAAKRNDPNASRFALWQRKLILLYTNPTRRFVMTENFDWDIYPVCESDETYTLEVYADPEEGGSL